MISFILKNSEVPFKVSLEEIFRYDKDDLDVLRDFCLVKKYHGNVGDILNGKHGFNLCPIDLKNDFLNLYTEQKERILRICLFTMDFSELSVEEKNIVERYFYWRDNETEKLFRSLFLVFTQALNRGKGGLLFPKGYRDCCPNSKLGLAISLKLSKFPKTPILEVEQYTEQKLALCSITSDSFCFEVFDEFKRIETFGEDLKKNYTFTKISKNTFFRNQQTEERDLFIRVDNLFLEIALPEYYKKSFKILAVYWLTSKYYKKEKNVTF